MVARRVQGGEGEGRGKSIKMLRRSHLPTFLNWCLVRGFLKLVVDDLSVLMEDKISRQHRSLKGHWDVLVRHR